ncbi:hypothetical protein D187_009610 [Cystobacter fuscus DSM 2262]|uniref:EBNA-1 protein n=1 Tax=Cystobacter fuscus (strain ATCC 25194 / DSM 2262 / NBRC 100088 / M29) TaxID=1242864 RepID=S9Q1H3_CYSF2|nr:hypothetical protein [Cystobacter fuscus]EPX55104.1 hypothetical protein D187_009610 [Cystobacter fuscus DSM 2262]
MSIASLKNNPAALLNTLSQLAGVQANVSQGQGKINAQLASQLLQSMSQLAGALQQIKSTLGQKDSFAPQMGQGVPQPQHGVGGPQGQSNPLAQLAQMLQALQGLLNGGAHGQVPGAGQPQLPGAGQPQLPGAGQPQLPGANTALPFGDAATLLKNLKTEQGALLEKISQGVRSGNITSQELGQLMQGVQQLAAATKSASADGQITLGEAANLSQMSTQNVMNTKAAFENGSKSSFAPFNPVAQTQANQLGALSQGVKQGTISNGELSMLAQEQGALADARSRSSTLQDGGKLMMAQQMLNSNIQLARLTNL